jgi:hypothetical protein
MPEGARYVGRPSAWGNPFRAGEPYRFMGLRGLVMGVAPDDRAGLVRLFEMYIATRRDMFERIREELGGRDLACWCPVDQRCHADVLLAIANSAGGES